VAERLLSGTGRERIWRVAPLAESSTVVLLPVRNGGRHVRITSKGQVTIPQGVREETGLLPDTEVEFVVESGGVRTARPDRRRISSLLA
jgi:AbrB family looped-hinge helix DNA binding protein